MTKYVWKRLLLLIPTILGVMFIVYTILSLTPGTPGKLILGQSATPEAINQLNEELGFNNPFLVRFFDYIVDALHGDFAYPTIHRDRSLTKSFQGFRRP